MIIPKRLTQVAKNIQSKSSQHKIINNLGSQEIIQSLQRCSVRYYSNPTINDVVIVSATRTPIGSFQAGLSSLSATALGGIAIESAVKKAGYAPENIDEVYMGNVCGAGLGQAPARQATIFGGLPKKTVCTTVNKVCSSGMKSIMLASQSLMLGHQVNTASNAYLHK